MKEGSSNTALVLEGGGFRGMYTAGVLDAFLYNGIRFPYVIGVSAGAAYGISYVSEQFGRNKEVNLKYTADPRYMSLGNLLRKGNLFDWDFVYGEVPDKLVPFDFDALFNSSTEFEIGVTNVQSGEAEYYSSRNLNRDELLAAITASSSLPFVSKMAKLHEQVYMDGGLADSVPVMHALNKGYERVVVILTRNKNYRKNPARFRGVIKACYRQYPKLVEAILSRADRYNKTLDELEQLEQAGRAYLIRPDQPMSVSRIENNAQKLDALYQQGFDEAKQQVQDLQYWLTH
ncbi:patatin-like phospholipase family protein [Carboxylicivirga taeanensis]|uniref:patatin-like phospholipase family protein n=1 Tax=Carboxylicivirga taeanensis TaxID=1416875 RepID=UPI003F6E4062